MSAPIRIQEETVGQAKLMAEGFWLIATAHRPGMSKNAPQINNRCLIFKVEDNGAPVLLVVNGVDPDMIAEVKRIETEAGAKVRYIVSPGCGHHLTLAAWHDAFEDAKVLLCPLRTPGTENGKKLMALARVALLDVNNPLPQFAGQVDFLMFHGLYGVPDLKQPGEGGSDGMLAMMKGMFAMMFRMNVPADELWLCHRATGTVLGGENLVWMFSPETHAKLPGMYRKMMPVGKPWVFAMARKVADKDTVSRCWQTILDWPIQAVMTYHDTPGLAVTDNAHEALRAAVLESGQMQA